MFEEFADQIGEEGHKFDTDVLKMGLVDNVKTPLAADATPTWSDYVANEVSTAGGYTANGETLNSSWAEAAGVGTLDADAVALSQDGSGFEDAYWAIIYNETNATDMAIAFIDLGGPISEVAGPITIDFHATGILTVTVS